LHEVEQRLADAGAVKDGDGRWRWRNEDGSYLYLTVDVLSQKSASATARSAGMRATTIRAATAHQGFDTKAEADRFLTSVEMSKITGSYVDPNRSKVTVGVLADQWLEAKLDLAPKTRDRYEGIIRAHVRPRWAKVRLSDVTHAEVQRWLARLDLAPATVRKMHRVLSMIMACAMKDGRLAVNPAAGVSLPRVREPEKRYLTDRQVAELA
jgi:hypothetical protein